MKSLTEQEKKTIINTFEITFGYSFNELCKISKVIRGIADKLDIPYGNMEKFLNGGNKTDN